MRVLHLIFRSRITTAAALSVVILLVALAYQVRHLLGVISAPSSYKMEVAEVAQENPTDLGLQQELMLLGYATSSDPSATASSDTDPIAMIGPIVVAQLVGQYAGLVETGKYNDDAGAAAAEKIAPNVKAAISYKTYAAADVRTDADISYERMLTYRADLREALAPLLRNREAELEIYAKFVETSDALYLDELLKVSANYKEAAQNVIRVTIPRDALNYHLDILNALEQFAATLDAMAKPSNDAFASVALLRSYNSAEQRMFVSFDALGNYYGQKLP